MKPILALVLGCLPLAALTVQSLAGLYPAAPAAKESLAVETVRAATRDTAQAADVARAEKPAVALADADLFAALPLGALQSIPVTNSLHALSGHWLEWTRSVDLIHAALDLDRRTATAPSAGVDNTAALVEKMRRQYEGMPPPGSKGVFRWLDDRAGAIDRRQGLAELKAELAAVLERINQEYRAEQYMACQADCDKGLSDKFAAVREAPQADKLRAAKRHSQFHLDLERQASDVRRASDDSARADVVRRFLAKYAADEGLNTWERNQVLRLRRELAQLDHAADAPRAKGK